MSSANDNRVLAISDCSGFTAAGLLKGIKTLGVQDKFAKILALCDSKHGGGPHEEISALGLGMLETKSINLDQLDVETIASTLRGVHTLALIPPTRGDKAAVTKALVQAAERAGVNNCIMVSWTGTHALDEPGTSCPMLADMKKLEDSFTQSEMGAGIKAKCIVRANFYAQNLLTYARQIVNDGQLPIPTGDGKIAPLDAEVLGQALATMVAASDLSKYQAQTITLTGPTAVDANGIARALGEALGRDVSAKQISMDEARTLLEQAKPALDKSEVQSIIEAYTLVKKGRMDQTSRDLENVLGVQNVSLIETIKRDAGKFKKLAGSA